MKTTPDKKITDEMKIRFRYDVELGHILHNTLPPDYPLKPWMLTKHAEESEGFKATTYTDRRKKHLCVTCCGKHYSAANVAWLLHTGEWPARTVGVYDGNGLNLKFDNLYLKGAGEMKGVYSRTTHNKLGVPHTVYFCRVGKWGSPIYHTYAEAASALEAFKAREL
jgi:hypothetical protein